MTLPPGIRSTMVNLYKWHRKILAFCTRYDKIRLSLSSCSWVIQMRVENWLSSIFAEMLIRVNRSCRRRLRKINSIGLVRNTVLCCSAVVVFQQYTYAQVQIFPGQKIVGQEFPTDFAFADFDGDGNLDVVSAHENYDEVSVHFGNGQGVFSSGHIIPIDGSPNSITTGDFNGDGWPDIATSNGQNFESGTVSVLFGNGAGMFPGLANLDVSATSSPIDITSSDFNGDGLTDIATANGFANQISVFIATGSDTFLPEATIDGLAIPIKLTSSDFDGDGNSDLVVTRQLSNDASVLLGTGDGSFTAGQTFFAGSGPETIESLDFNQNGIADLAIVNVGADTVSVFEGVGNGEFVFATSFSTGEQPNDVTSADFNGDGFADFASTFEGRYPYFVNGITIVLGSSNGGLEQPYTLDLGAGHYSIASADIDGDGTSDIAAGHAFDITVLLGSQGNPPTVGIGSSIITNFAPRGLTAVDFDNDGFLDLVYHGVNDDSVYFAIGAGDGSFSQSQIIGLGFSVNVNSFAIADVDNDGFVDILIADRNPATTDDVLVLLNDGTGSFVATGEVFDVGESANTIRVADFNNDGFLDLVTSHSLSDDVSVLLGNGDGSFQVENRVPVGEAPVDVAVGDFDGDAFADLVVPARVGDLVSIRIGRGDGTFDSATSVVGDASPRSVVVRDFDLDGNLDFASANQGNFGGPPETANISMGLGNGAFSGPQSYLIGSSRGDLFVDDFNNDGITDIYIGGFTILYGLGDGTFADQVRHAVPSNAYSSTVGDFDCDGLTDVVVVGFNRIGTSLNQGSASGLTGDVNGDGILDLLDVSSFVNAISTGQFNPVADFNQDGNVDLLDVQPFVDALSGNTAIVVEGTTGNDSIEVAQCGPNVSVKVNGVSRMYSANVSITINGFGGNDVIYSSFDGVTINAGGGNDRVTVDGPGASVVFGGPGDDILKGGTGDDSINGGSGDDIIFGRSGNDSLDGAGDADLVYGGPGDDTLNGGSGFDTLDGGDGTDTASDTGEVEISIEN